MVELEGVLHHDYAEVDSLLPVLRDGHPGGADVGRSVGQLPDDAVPAPLAVLRTKDPVHRQPPLHGKVQGAGECAQHARHESVKRFTVSPDDVPGGPGKHDVSQSCPSEI